uniref:Uncharacterized protein n=1 Tax=Trichogramma kaykai TaxID=54128 RepID=A0ABD2WA90_9HYME
MRIERFYKSRDEAAICLKPCKIRPSAPRAKRRSQQHSFTAMHMYSYNGLYPRCYVRVYVQARSRLYNTIYTYALLLSLDSTAPMFFAIRPRIFPYQKTHTLGANVTECPRDADAMSGVTSTEICKR